MGAKRDLMFVLALAALLNGFVQGQEEEQPDSCPPPEDEDAFMAAMLEDPLKGKKIVCLYSSASYYTVGFVPNLINPKLCTHINYEFAFLDSITYELIVGDSKLDIQQNFYRDTTNLKCQNPNLKVILTLGGWVDSTEKYSKLVKDPMKRANFIEKVVPFLKKHNFDGLDIAWEYPNGWQGSINVSREDKPNFVIFLQEIRQAFDNNSLELSISGAASRDEVLAAYDVPEISKVVDHINLMSFDLHGEWEGKTGHHARFGQKHKDDFLNIKEALRIWERQGVDRSKLIVGIPAYGKSYTLASSSDHALGAQATRPGNPGPNTKRAGYLAYNEICSFVNFEDWTEEEDFHAGPFAYKGDQWVSYDSPQQVIWKASYIINKNYGGVLFKDLSSDDYSGLCFEDQTYPLLTSIYNEIVSRVNRVNTKVENTKEENTKEGNTEEENTKEGNTKE